MQTRSRLAVRNLVSGMAGHAAQSDCRVPLPRRSGRWRLVVGMVLANRPWLLVPALKSALVAALATGAIATINSTVWVLARSLSWWRLIIATTVSIALVVGWLVIDGELWDHPDNDSPHARGRSRLYNTSTLVTLTAGVIICYIALYLVNLAWALFILDPTVMSSYLSMSIGYSDLFVLAWFVASAATVGGALGSGLESDEAIRAAAYSKREEERRQRLAREARK
jgi:signal transduction histidine kinase